MGKESLKKCIRVIEKDGYYRPDQSATQEKWVEVSTGAESVEPVEELNIFGWDTVYRLSKEGSVLFYFVGSAASKLGALGGSKTSAEKAAASRANGAKGGRPRKHPAAAIASGAELS